MYTLRFRVFQKYAEKDDIYTQWNTDRILEWSKASGRYNQKLDEMRHGWQFPYLCSEQDHKDFDEWLKNKYPVDII